MELTSIKHSFCLVIITILIMQEAKSEENQNTKESTELSTQTEMHNPLSSLIYEENGTNASSQQTEQNLRVKRQYSYGYYNRRYPYPIPVIFGGGGVGVGRGFGGRGFGGRGIGGRGGGGIGGRGGGGGHGGGGGGGHGGGGRG